MNWLPFPCAALACLLAQQPALPPTLAAINAYVRRIDADRTLTTKWHVHTYGHAAKPGVDSLFWVFNTDFQFSTIIVYFSGSKIVKLVETARTETFFTENSYYLQNNKLLFLKNRQVHCPITKQLAALRRNTFSYTRASDYFFRGAYYFAKDSCVSRWERGKSEWRPEYDIPGGDGRYVTVPEIFPLQAARYLAIYDKAR